MNLDCLKKNKPHNSVQYRAAVVPLRLPCSSLPFSMLSVGYAHPTGARHEAQPAYLIA